MINKFIKGARLHLAVHVKSLSERIFRNLYFLKFGLARVQNVVDAYTFYETINDLFVVPLILEGAKRVKGKQQQKFTASPKGGKSESHVIPLQG